MIGIAQIASYVPADFESNDDKKEQFGVDNDYLDNKIGVKRKPRKEVAHETSDMCVFAYEALRKKSDFASEEIDCLVVCTQNPDGNGLPHTSAIVHGKLGLAEHVAAFDISLGCSGYVYALSIVSAFMQANNLKKGLLFTADPYSKILNPNDKATSLLFGDAASVTLLTDTPTWILEKGVFQTRGREHNQLERQGDFLYMNGRAIFNFAMTAVPQQIRDLLDSQGYELDDLDLVITHQASKFLIDTLVKRIMVDPGKVPSNLSEIGNTVSSSIPILLAEAIQRNELQRILISGFGVGLSWASAVLVRP